jgi:hypothetical protein
VAISKRLRFEVLKRDGFKCHYCHNGETLITVDHVIPRTLGGTDDPTNLVASCDDCNSGKTSTLPGGASVDGPGSDVIRWTRAMKRAAYLAREEHNEMARYREHFKAQWGQWHFTADKSPIPLPDDWTDSIDRFCAEGLPDWMWNNIIRRAMGGVSGNHFRHARDLARNKLYELQRRARAEFDGQPDESTFSERIAAQFRESWGDADSQPSADDLRMLDVHARAANAAGYEEVSIACAAFKGGEDCNPEIKDYLDSVDDVFDLERTIGDDGPFGKGGIDRELIPTQDERDAQIMAEAAVVAWRRAWVEHPDGRGEQILDLYPDCMEAEEAIEGAKWAGSEGDTDVIAGGSAARKWAETELAASAWDHAYWCATNTLPTPEQSKAVMADLEKLGKTKAWRSTLTVAATYAGAHGTTHMQFGLNEEQARAIGVPLHAQAILDTWTRAWLIASDRLPSQAERKSFCESITGIADGRLFGEVASAALMSGLYQSTELSPGIAWATSPIEAASNLTLIGGE